VKLKTLCELQENLFESSWSLTHACFLWGGSSGTGCIKASFSFVFSFINIKMFKFSHVSIIFLSKHFFVVILVYITLEL
jgi:hypothetical protein